MISTAPPGSGWEGKSGEPRRPSLKIVYGLGLRKVDVPGHGTFWGHDGTVWGAGAISMIRADGTRQMSVAVNLMRLNKLDSSGRPQHHPLDDALQSLYEPAMCGDGFDEVGRAVTAIDVAGVRVRPMSAAEPRRDKVLAGVDMTTPQRGTRGAMQTSAISRENVRAGRRSDRGPARR